MPSINFRSLEDKSKTLVDQIRQATASVQSARESLDTRAVQRAVIQLRNMRTSLNQIKSDLSKYQPETPGDKTARDSALALVSQGLSLISKIST